MKKMNPIERSRYINEQYKEYLKSSFEFGNDDLQHLFEEQLLKERLFKGPYVAMSLPFKRGHNLSSLIEQGVVCKSFKKLNDINLERPLYSHQEKAIRQIKNGRSAVVTTGTGSGKTECFLYPILNDLLFDIENGNSEVGIRAIFLYPMNALVNDQVERIRKTLKNTPEITFGFFTGDTPESASVNERLKLSEESDEEIPDNELISRKEIRENPPHLLFTNYSMLEYLLIRPNDYALFVPERLSNWKYVVLDEAHTYSGSLGIEISLLLRRLTGLAPQKPRFILTSATLGEQGKSEKDIVRFATSLTSSDFSVDDIIFSDRITLANDSLYRISGNDYSLIKSSVEDVEKITSIAKKYIDINSSNVREIIYTLLSRDKNVHNVYALLKDSSKDFCELETEFLEIMSEEQLIDLIDVINMAERNGVELFSLKYHSFVRPLSGAYLTYGKEHRLSLTKTNEIDGMKAFEVGNCRFCNSPYIIGKIVKREDDLLDYLIQNKEIDIYENYGDEEFAKIDYFLLENSVNEEEVEKDSILPYTVCSCCGVIYESDNINARKCKCGEEFHFTVYKVLQKNNGEEETIYNNLRQCPCCGHRAKSGIIKALNVGKDEGTALIAQMLFEAIDEGEPEVLNKSKLTLVPSSRREIVKKTERIKQYLTFSDSRQQASFAAVFFDSNHVRMLRKRLIWEVIKEHHFADITVDEMTSYLTEKIRNKGLFQNNMNSHKNAWAAVLVDLLRVDGAYDGEGHGLYHFDLDVNEVLGAFDAEQFSDAFGFPITLDEVYELMQIAFEVFRSVSAISYAKSTLTPDERNEVLEFQRFNNYLMLNAPKRNTKNGTEEISFNGIRSFLPVTGETNSVVRYVMKVFECDSSVAKNVLDILFGLLIQCGEQQKTDQFLYKHEKKEAYQIDASHYVIKNYKSVQYYQCKKCGRLTPHNIRNKCVQDRCMGELIPVNPDVALSNNYYRKQYINKKIESIVIKEHTAQINRKVAKEYQKEFKNQKINILSCSTTFEMGIDIGGLETVFMRNVPPTPANYVQRAGRAGRRKDSSAYILTYCSTSSHDFTYFSSPEKMISGVINPPYFNVLNRKIITRHLMATSFGFFFREYPEYFKSLDALVISGDGIEKFKKYISSHPSELNEYINSKILPEAIYSNFRDFKWYDEMNGEDAKLMNFVNSVTSTIKEFEQARDEAKKKQDVGDENASKEVTYFMKQISKLKEESVLDNLSNYCVIPKYGFPVDVVNLKVYDNGKPTTTYDLTRDLRIAISEYAPDSEIIVDGNKFTSKYITLNKNGEFTKNWYVTCPTCKKVNIFLSKGDNTLCKYCGKNIAAETWAYFIEPVNGFKTGVNKESTRLKPKRSYSGEVSYVGNGRTDEQHLVLGNVLGVETSSDDELLVMNKSGFYMCPMCGYSNIVKKYNGAPQTLVHHKNYKQYNCDCDELQYLHIGHKFQTDVARFTIPMLNTKGKVGYPQALSFLYAFLEGISIALEIDRNDIDGVLEMNLEWQSYDVILYDNVPGGAGHIKRLLQKEAILNSLKAGLDKVNQGCCDENTSCYNCLRNYRNQSYHNKLQRKLAIEVLSRLIFDIETTAEIYQSERWHMNSGTSDGMQYKRLVLGSDGRNPGNESADEIWNDLLDDCFETDEIDIVNLIKNRSPQIIDRPYYNKTVRIEESGKELVANLLWEEKKVMLFLNDSFEDYQLAKTTGWNVYCTQEPFDVDKFLEKVSI